MSLTTEATFRQTGNINFELLQSFGFWLWVFCKRRRRASRTRRSLFCSACPLTWSIAVSRAARWTAISSSFLRFVLFTRVSANLHIPRAMREAFCLWTEKDVVHLLLETVYIEWAEWRPNWIISTVYPIMPLRRPTVQVKLYSKDDAASSRITSEKECSLWK